MIMMHKFKRAISGEGLLKFRHTGGGRMETDERVKPKSKSYWDAICTYRTARKASNAHESSAIKLLKHKQWKTCDVTK